VVRGGLVWLACSLPASGFRRGFGCPRRATSCRTRVAASCRDLRDSRASSQALILRRAGPLRDGVARETNQPNKKATTNSKTATANSNSKQQQQLRKPHSKSERNGQGRQQPPGQMVEARRRAVAKHVAKPGIGKRTPPLDKPTRLATNTTN
jgi:uncharacterized Zn finger protein